SSKGSDLLREVFVSPLRSGSPVIFRSKARDERIRGGGSHEEQMALMLRSSFKSSSEKCPCCRGTFGPGVKDQKQSITKVCKNRFICQSTVNALVSLQFSQVWTEIS